VSVFYGKHRRLTCLFVAQVARSRPPWAAPMKCANPNEEDRLTASRPDSAFHMKSIVPSLANVSSWFCTILVRHCLRIMNSVETPPLGAELFSQRSNAGYVYQGYDSILNSDTSPDDLDQLFSFEAFNEDVQLADGRDSSLSQPGAPELLGNTTPQIDVQELRCIPINQEPSKPTTASVQPQELGIVHLLSPPLVLPLCISFAFANRL
jgi:hypothetical protein